MRWGVFRSKAANKDLDALDDSTAQRVEARLRELEEGPTDTRIAKRLKGDSGLWSSRVGDWRILYIPDSDLMLIVVDRILHRREAYRNL